MRTPGVGEVWTHFKGGVYVVKGYSMDAEGDNLVLRILYELKEGHVGPPYSRTIDNFCGPVDTRAAARFTHGD